MSKFSTLHKILTGNYGWQCLELAPTHAYYMAKDCNIKLANGEAFTGGNGRVALTWIQSETRGHGTEALGALCQALDKIGLICNLWAEAFGQAPQDVLVRWYGRHGFASTDDPHQPQEMTRLPLGD